jgi:hypothetical protein
MVERAERTEADVKEHAQEMDVDEQPRHDAEEPKLEITSIVAERVLQRGNEIDNRHTLEPEPEPPSHVTPGRDLLRPAPTSEPGSPSSKLPGPTLQPNAAHPEGQPQGPSTPPCLAEPIRPAVLQLRPPQLGENKGNEPKAIIIEHDQSLDDELLSLVDDVKPKTDQPTSLPPPPPSKKTPGSGTVTPAKVGLI